MAGIDQHIAFVRHDNRRHVQKSRRARRYPVVARSPGRQSRGNGIPAGRQRLEHLARFPYSIRNIDSHQIAIERHATAVQVVYGLEGGQGDIRSAVHKARALAIPAPARHPGAGAGAA